MSSRHHIRARRALAGLVVLVAVAAACSAPTPAVNTTSGETFDSVMAAVRGPDPDGINKVEALADLGRGVAAQVAPLVASADIEERFTGLFYFSRVAEKGDVDVIAKGLNDSDLGNRVTAAATLLRLGDRRGLALLNEARTSDAILSFSMPPQLLRDYVAEALTLATFEDAPRAVVAAAQGLRGLAAPARGPLQDVTVVRTGDTISVTVRMQFHGRGATQSVVDEWVKTAKFIWNGKHRDSCCSLALNLETALEGPDRPGYVQVRVNQLPLAARDRAFVDHLGGKGRDDDLKMVIASKNSGYVFAHELAHVLGVPDEYRDTPTGSVPIAGAVNDISLGREPSLMAQTWQTNGVFPIVQARHIEAMLKQYNVPPPVAAATTAPPTASPSTTASPTQGGGTTGTPTTAPADRTTAPPTTPPTAPPPTATAEPRTAAPTPPPTPPPTPAPTAVPTPAPTLTTTIAPARDLTGTWRGGIASTGHYQGQVTCKWTGSATVQFTQTGNTLSGQAQLTFQTSQAVLAGADCAAGSEQYGITGTVSSSSVTFTFTGGEGGWYGTARGSFTTDLMSGTFAGSGDDYGTGCFQLSRTGVGALPGCGQ